MKPTQSTILILSIFLSQISPSLSHSQPPSRRAFSPPDNYKPPSFFQEKRFEIERRQSSGGGGPVGANTLQGSPTGATNAAPTSATPSSTTTTTTTASTTPSPTTSPPPTTSSPPPTTSNPPTTDNPTTASSTDTSSSPPPTSSSPPPPPPSSSDTSTTPSSTSSSSTNARSTKGSKTSSTTVGQQTVIITVNGTPTSSVIPDTAPQGSGSSSSSKTWAIVGGVAGGIVGLVAAVFLIFKLTQRRFSTLDDDEDGAGIKWPELVRDGDNVNGSSLNPMSVRRREGAGVEMSEIGSQRDSFENVGFDTNNPQVNTASNLNRANTGAFGGSQVGGGQYYDDPNKAYYDPYLGSNNFAAQNSMQKVDPSLNNPGFQQNEFNAQGGGYPPSELGYQPGPPTYRSNPNSNDGDHQHQQFQMQPIQQQFQQQNYPTGEPLGVDNDRRQSMGFGNGGRVMPGQLH